MELAIFLYACGIPLTMEYLDEFVHDIDGIPIWMARILLFLWPVIGVIITIEYLSQA